MGILEEIIRKSLLLVYGRAGVLLIGQTDCIEHTLKEGRHISIFIYFNSKYYL